MIDRKKKQQDAKKRMDEEMQEIKASHEVGVKTDDKAVFWLCYMGDNSKIHLISILLGVTFASLMLYNVFFLRLFYITELNFALFCFI